MRQCIANGEPEDARCEFCPIRDKELCPDLDPLDYEAFRFTNIMDHPAHEHYRHELFELAWPDLPPSQVAKFIARREIIWEFYAEQRRKKLAEVSHARDAGTGNQD